MKPVQVNYYYTYTAAINTTYEYHLYIPTFGLHGPQRPQPTYTTTILSIVKVYTKYSKGIVVV